MSVNGRGDITTLDELLLLNVRRLEACAYTAEVVNRDLLVPTTPSQKADLLIAAENLVQSTYALVQEIRGMIWQGEPTQT
jgi:hypothetical protein